MKHPTTDLQIKNIQATDKVKKYGLGDSMYVEVHPSGSKYFRLKYYFRGVEKRLALGVYPDVSLKMARERRFQARSLLQQGIDPLAHRAAVKSAQSVAGQNTFEVLAHEWLRSKKPKWKASHYAKVLSRLATYVFPRLGGDPVSEIKTKDLHLCLKRIEELGFLETAHRTLNYCTCIFDFAIASGRAESNPAYPLRKVLASAPLRHHPSITEPSKIGGLLRAIDAYLGSDSAKAALRLAPLLFVRPGELRRAHWSEVDLAAGEWQIPATRMKMGKKHIVPLSTQARALLTEQKLVARGSPFVFPSVRDRNRPMSENTVNAALRRMGYSNQEMTGHGFRSMASTRLNESGLFSPDAIERQLAHAERDSVRAAYSYAEYLDVRREMMQWWGDYLDGLKASVSEGA